LEQGRSLERAIVFSWLIPGAGHMYLTGFASGLGYAIPYLSLAVLYWSKVLPYLVVIGPLLLIWIVAMRGVLLLGGKEPSIRKGLRWLRENAR
jgi:hypothetical protein